MYLRLFSISSINVHDLTILKENSNEFIRGYKYSSFVGDKGYIIKEFTKYLKNSNVYLIPIKRKNMVKIFMKKIFINHLIKLGKIETSFYRLTELFPKNIRTISKKGLAIKLPCFIIASNITTKVNC